MHPWWVIVIREVPDLSGLPGIHIEVKRVEKLNVVEAMEQSIRDSERMRKVCPLCSTGGIGIRGL